MQTPRIPYFTHHHSFLRHHLLKQTPFRHGSSDSHRLLFDRMDEGDLSCVQADAAVRIGTTSAILQVAFDRTAYSRQLATDLMMTTGEEFNLKECVVVAGCQCAVVENGEFGIFRARLGYVGFVLRLVADEPVLQMSFGLLGRTLHNSPIYFIY